MHSLVDNQELAQSLAPAARTATANGTAVQSGADAYARAAILDVGLWTDGTHKFTFDRSTDGSTWTEMVAAELGDPAAALDTTDLNSVNITSAATDNVIHQIDLLTTDEYVRVTVTVSGSPSTGLVASGKIQTGHPLRFAGDNNPMGASGYRW